MLGRSVVREEVAEDCVRSGKAGTRELTAPMTINGVNLKPSMVSVQPIDITGRKWWLVVSSRLSEVDAVLGQVFRRLAVGSILVVIAVTAILVSTSVQMIRNRIRLERSQTSGAAQLHWFWTTKVPT